MSFDDKGWPTFPTRHGGSIGAGLENRMLGIVGGPDGIRTRIETLPDGSKVMLRTRNGMPEFTKLTPMPSSVAGTRIRLLCQLMSEVYRHGAQVGDSGGINLYDTWPGFPVSDGIITGDNAYNGRFSQDFSNTQGASTWYDTRSEGAQFDHVLSWASVVYDGQVGHGAGGAGYLQFLEPTGTVGYTVGGAYRQLPMGSASPGHIWAALTAPHRFCHVPSAPTQLCRNGEPTGIHGYIVGACSVLIDDVEHYRLLTLPNFNDASNRYHPVIVTARTDGTVLNQTAVILPASVPSIEILLHAGRWNSSGTEATCFIRYTDSESVSRSDLLKIDWTGSSEIVQVTCSKGVVRTGNTVIPGNWFILWSSYNYDNVTTSQRLCAIDYIGDSLSYIRLEEVKTLYVHATSAQAKNQYNKLVSASISKTFGTRVHSRFILEPAGNEVWHGLSDTAGETAYSETQTWVQDPNYPDNPSMQKRTSISSTDSSVGESGLQATWAAFSCDIRQGYYFITVPVETAEGRSNWKYSATGSTTKSLYVEQSATLGTYGLKALLVAAGGECQLGLAENTEIWQEPLAPTSSLVGTGELWPYSTYSTTSAANTTSAGWTGVLPLDGLDVVSVQSNVARDGTAVFSLGHISNWPLSWSGISAENFAAMNKIIRPSADTLTVENLSLPTYDGVAKWMTEPLLLPEQVQP